MFKKIIAIYSEKHIKLRNKETAFEIVESGGAYRLLTTGL
jgi:hypothetical protein